MIDPWPSTQRSSPPRSAPSTTSASAAPAMKSATTASTAMPQPAIAMPVWPVGTKTDATPRAPRLEVELERDRHLPDRAVGADGEHDRRRHLRGSRRSRSRGRAAAGAGRAAPRRAVARARELVVVAEEHVQAVLDVEPVRDAALQQVDPRRREASALRGDADERGVRVEAERIVDRADDRDAVLRVARRARRVEDRDDVVAPVAKDASHRLPVVRVGAEALGEDEIAASSDTEPRSSEGSCTPSTSSTPGHGSCAMQEVAVEIDVVEEARDRARRRRCRGPDSIMQPSMQPRPSARAACTIRTASRMPPDFASLTLIPCARSAQAATSASVWQSSST